MAERKSKVRAAKGKAKQAQVRVAVTHENFPQVAAVLLQQSRDWNIRNNLLLREIAYYARCTAEGVKPTDAGAKEAIAAPASQVP